MTGCRHKQVPTSCALEVCRLLPADSEMRGGSDASQPNAAEAGPVGGTSVSGRESVMAAKPDISSRPPSASDPGKSFNAVVVMQVSLSSVAVSLSSGHVSEHHCLYDGYVPEVNMFVIPCRVFKVGLCIRCV